MTVAPHALHGYENSGAFQEASEAWDRPSVPTGPSLGDGRSCKATGGKPDWYRMITDNDIKSTKQQDGVRAKIYGSSVQVLILIFVIELLLCLIFLDAG